MDLKEKRHKILIIDDDMFLLEMYSLKFDEAGFDLEIAKSGEEAIEKLSSKEYIPDVILLDVLMPTLNGFEFLKKIKENHIAPKTKIIILSNLSQKEEIEQGMSLGADDYIVKAHHTPTEVMEKVKQLISSSH